MRFDKARLSTGLRVHYAEAFSSAIRSAPSSRAEPQLRRLSGWWRSRSLARGLRRRSPARTIFKAALRELPDPIPEPFAREFQSGTVYRPVPTEFFAHHRGKLEDSAVPLAGHDRRPGLAIARVADDCGVVPQNQ